MVCPAKDEVRPTHSTGSLLIETNGLPLSQSTNNNVYIAQFLRYNYIHQVNGETLADILFSLLCVCVCVSVRPSVRPCAFIFRCKYLENGLR